MADIKELKELLEAVDTITTTAFEAFADGFQFDDLTRFIPVFSKVKTAMEGISTIGTEVKDLDVEELKELISWAITFVFTVIKKAKELVPKDEDTTDSN